jgi:hypothetical protein
MQFQSYWLIKFLNLGLFGVFFFYLSLRGFISRKPVVISTKLYFFLMISIFLPSLAMPFMLTSRSIDLRSMTWVTVPMMLFFGFFFWKMFKGYSVYGITDQSFRKALLSSLDQSNLEYTEDMTGIHLKAHDVTLRVSIFMGIGQIRPRGKDSGDLMEKMMPFLKAELEKPGVEFNSKPFFFYAGMALIFLILVFVEISLFQTIGNLK